MSFFKKLTEEFKELKANLEDKPKKEKKKEEVKPEKPVEGYGDQSHGQPSNGGQQAPSYGQPQYDGQPQQQQQYGAPPPSHAGPPGQPPLPPGWITQFDQKSQRWYFVEQATGRTQWDPPAAAHINYAPPPTGPSDPYAGDRGHGEAPGAPGGFYNQYGGAMPAGGPGGSGRDQNAQQYYGDVKKTEEKSDKKSSDKKNMLLAGAGGLALGGVAGAMLARM